MLLLGHMAMLMLMLLLLLLGHMVMMTLLGHIAVFGHIAFAVLEVLLHMSSRSFDLLQSK